MLARQTLYQMSHAPAPAPAQGQHLYYSVLEVASYHSATFIQRESLESAYGLEGGSQRPKF